MRVRARQRPPLRLESDCSILVIKKNTPVMLKRFIIIIAGFAIVVLSLGAVKIAQVKEASSAPHTMPPSAVTSSEAKAESWQPLISSVGSIAPVEGATLSNELEGTIDKILVENGAVVKAGDVLMHFDTSVEEAQLNAANARLDFALLQGKRAEELREKQTNSQAEVDQAKAQSDQAKAEVAGLKATIEKKTIRAPFDGRVGIRLVNLGQFVARGLPLIPLQKLNPIYVNFSIPQRQLPDLKVGQTVKVIVDAYGDRTFLGKVSAINPEVDSSTRNVSVQALLENPDELLRSGMFARVDVELPTGAPVVVLPATSISYAAYGNSVFIIEKMKNADGSEYLGVRQQFVKLGHTRGDLISVDGVKPGEQVVSSGVFKLRNGLPVQVNNSAQPGSSAKPKPANT
jgi:membrane fusion protein (multidrug efflux system)